jgi:uncharacterized protein involved in high-affinity Fe2+ transport
MRTPSLLPFLLLLSTCAAFAKEYPIGEPQSCPGLEIGAVYLQPIEMACRHDARHGRFRRAPGSRRTRHGR